MVALAKGAPVPPSLQAIEWADHPERRLIRIAAFGGVEQKTSE
jgi:hypothetical protein